MSKTIARISGASLALAFALVLGCVVKAETYVSYVATGTPIITGGMTDLGKLVFLGLGIACGIAATLIGIGFAFKQAKKVAGGGKKTPGA